MGMNFTCTHKERNQPVHQTRPNALPLRPGRANSFPNMNLHTLAGLFLSIPLALSAGENPAAANPPGADAKKARAEERLSPELRAALQKLVIPGVKINAEEWSVDVDARVCLVKGMLELIACTKDSKEHESIIAVEAKPSHIHTALLLLRAKPGHPAMQKAVDRDDTRFMSLPPRGGAVDVFLLVKDAEGKETERPISDFITQVEQDQSTAGAKPAEDAKPGKFPTHTFLFAGSVLNGNDKGPRKYLCDLSGNVISIATFGDELLCLPGVHDQADSLRTWQADGKNLPPLNSKVILRLRPQVEPPAEPPAR